MANIQRNFVAGRMNKSLDERLIPNGEYIDALNVRLGSTEESEIGAVENAKGNVQVTRLQYIDGTALSSSARCIGVFEDGANETIYWFVHDNNYLNNGLSLLKKLTKFSLDNDGFPKSRSIRQLHFYLKYFLLLLYYQIKFLLIHLKYH